MRHCYVCCTQKSVYSQNTWPRPLSQQTRWLPKRRAAAGVSMVKNENISVFIDRQYTIEEKSDWRFFLCSCRACLAATMAMALYHGRSILATQLTSSSHNSRSRNYEADFCVEKWFLYRSLPKSEKWLEQLNRPVFLIDIQRNMVGFVMEGHI